MSDSDKIKNKAEELAGRGKETLGAATHDRDLQAEGQTARAFGALDRLEASANDLLAGRAAAHREKQKDDRQHRQKREERYQ